MSLRVTFMDLTLQITMQSSFHDLTLIPMKAKFPDLGNLLLNFQPLIDFECEYITSFLPLLGITCLFD